MERAEVDSQALGGGAHTRCTGADQRALAGGKALSAIVGSQETDEQSEGSMAQGESCGRRKIVAKVECPAVGRSREVFNVVRKLEDSGKAARRVRWRRSNS